MSVSFSGVHGNDKIKRGHPTKLTRSCLSCYFFFGSGSSRCCCCRRGRGRRCSCSCGCYRCIGKKDDVYIVRRKIFIELNHSIIHNIPGVVWA